MRSIYHVRHRCLDLLSEPLEPRRLLAVNVELTASDHIIVTGDGADSEISMLISSGPFEISGDDVVVRRDPEFDIDALRDIRIDMGDGRDVVNIRGANDLSLRDIRIDQRGASGAGRTEVNVEGMTTRDIRIEGGAGQFQISLDDVNARDLRIANRMEDASDYSRLYVSESNIRDLRWNVADDSNSFLDVDRTAARDFRIEFADGNGKANVFQSTLSGRLTLRGDEAGLENDHSLRFEQSVAMGLDFRGGEAQDNLRLISSTLGQLRFSGGDEVDVIELSNAEINGDVRIQMGNGDDVLTTPNVAFTDPHVTTIRGNMSADLGDGDNRVQFGTFRGIVSVEGRLSLTGGDGRDEAELESHNNTRWGSLRARLGGGNDELQVRGITIEGATQIDTGAGEDFLSFSQFNNLGTGDRSEMMFGSGVNINTGQDADAVRLSFVDVNGSSRINTGSGRDSITWFSAYATSNPTVSLNTGRDDDAIFLYNMHIAAPLTVNGGSGDDVLSRSFDSIVDANQVRNMEREQLNL